MHDHTEGPWETFGMAKGMPGVGSRNYGTICRMEQDGFANTLNEYTCTIATLANAQLIAESPTMLEMLEWVREWVCDGTINGVEVEETFVLDSLDDVIKLATYEHIDG